MYWTPMLLVFGNTPDHFFKYMFKDFGGDSGDTQPYD